MVGFALRLSCILDKMCNLYVWWSARHFHNWNGKTTNFHWTVRLSKTQALSFIKCQFRLFFFICAWELQRNGSRAISAWSEYGPIPRRINRHTHTHTQYTVRAANIAKHYKTHGIIWHAQKCRTIQFPLRRIRDMSSHIGCNYLSVCSCERSAHRRAEIKFESIKFNKPADRQRKHPSGNECAHQLIE